MELCRSQTRRLVELGSYFIVTGQETEFSGRCAVLVITRTVLLCGTARGGDSAGTWQIKVSGQLLCGVES